MVPEVLTVKGYKKMEMEFQFYTEISTKRFFNKK
jgi:hypothetical protein